MSSLSSHTSSTPKNVAVLEMCVGHVEYEKEIWKEQMKKVQEELKMIIPYKQYMVVSKIIPYN